MKTLYRFGQILVALTTLWGLASQALGSGSMSSGRDFITLRGRALYSFTPNHFVVQTDKYLFKIPKDKLSVADLAQLTAASEGQTNVTLSIPASSVIYLWYNPLSKVMSSEKYNVAARAMREGVRFNGDLMHLRGKAVYSFSEPFFLLESNGWFYRINKSKLTAEERGRMERVTVGNASEFSFRSSAVDAVWYAKSERMPRATEEQDKIEFATSEIRLRGTVLYSFDTAYSLIKSRDIIYQILRDKIATTKMGLLDVPGSRISVTAPLSAVKYAWLSQPYVPQVREINPSLM